MKAKSSWMALLLLGFGMIASTPAEGFFDCCCDRQWYAEVEGLYWKPMHDPIFVARQFQGGTSTLVGQVRPRDDVYLTGNYNTGIRARIGTQCDDWFSDISFLSYRSTNHVKQDRGAGFNNMRMIGPSFSASNLLTVFGSTKFRYQNVDLRSGPCFCMRDNLTLFLYGNARWVQVDYKYKVGGPSQEDVLFFNSAEESSDFNGGGFGLGAGGSCHLLWGFNLNAHVGAMAIIGESRLKNFHSVALDGDDLRMNVFANQEQWCHILPAFDFKMGIDRGFCFSCFRLDAEFGYELNYYARLLQYSSLNILPPTGSAEVPSMSIQDIGFAGPYLKISLCF